MAVIVALVQMVKRFWPQADNLVWYGLSVLFGALGEVGVYLVSHEGEPWTTKTIITFVVMVILGALAAGKAYDDLAQRGKLARASSYQTKTKKLLTNNK